MTHKQYLRKVEKLEREGDLDALSELERQRMEDLDHHLDKDFIEAMDDGSYDADLEAEYGDLF
tara:strand:+ start:60 stop:248 length:189 start_codon:yes stop_codon:yes gene_type:complete